MRKSRDFTARGTFLIAMLESIYIYIVTGILYILLKRSSQLGDLLMSKKRILYADDFVGFKDYFCRAAERLGHEPVFVDDGARAWELIQAGKHFDLIISDNDMPELTGIELLKLVRNHPVTLETPFVIYSANDSWRLQLDVAELGASFVSKATSLSFPYIIAEYLPKS